MLVGPGLESCLFSFITTPRDILFQSSFPMSVIRSLDVRSRSCHLPVREGWTGRLRHGLRTASRGEIGTDFVVVSLWHHFAPGGERLSDPPKPCSQLHLQSEADGIRGVCQVAGREVAIQPLLATRTTTIRRVAFPPIPRRIASSERLLASAWRCEKPCLMHRHALTLVTIWFYIWDYQCSEYSIVTP